MKVASSWEERFDELLRGASSVLEPLLGLTLRNAGTTAWEPQHGDGSLDAVIADLPGCPGPEADWVIAFVQSTPRVVTDFHTLGKGQYYSKYLVMRAPNDPAEIDALNLGLPDLDEATRQTLYSDRKRHKVLTLFLHELGHTLGGVHRAARDTIMSPTYDASERGYDEATLGLFRITVPARFEGKDPYRDVKAYLERMQDGWMKAEWTSEIERLAQWSGPAPELPRGATRSSVPPETPRFVVPVGFETMPKEDRQLFDEALSLESKDPRAAWGTALPLFESHPAVRAVQALRCRLAKARKFYPEVIVGQCARLQAFGPEGGPPPS